MNSWFMPVQLVSLQFNVCLLSAWWQTLDAEDIEILKNNAYPQEAHILDININIIELIRYWLLNPYG